MATRKVSFARAVASPRSLPRPAAKGLAIWTAATLLVLNLVGLLLLFQVANITTETYALERMENERSHWQANNFELEADAAELQSLARIDNQARNKLKLVPATEFIYVTVPAAPTVSPDAATTPVRPAERGLNP